MGENKKRKEIPVQSFVKCYIINKLEGTENSDVKIGGLEDYMMPKPEREFQLYSSSDKSKNYENSDGAATESESREENLESSRE